MGYQNESFSSVVSGPSPPALFPSFFPPLQALSPLLPLFPSSPPPFSPLVLIPGKLWLRYPYDLVRCFFAPPSVRDLWSQFSAISMVLPQILVDFQSVSIDFCHSLSFSVSFNQLRSVWLGQKRRNLLTTGRWGKQPLNLGALIERTPMGPYSRKACFCLLSAFSKAPS